MSGADWLTAHAEDHTGAVGELNQYWYSAHTIGTLCDAVRECLLQQQQRPGGSKLQCAFVSTPSLYYSLPASERVGCRVFDYDTALGDDVVFYDFNHPEAIPEELRGAFAIVVIDPPFITPETWRHYAVTAKLLLAPEGRVIGTTIIENAPLLRELLGVHPNTFLPSIPQLPYQYAAYTNYTSEVLSVRNPEVPADPAELLAQAATAKTVEQVRSVEGEKPIRKQTKSWEEMLADAEANGQM